MKIQDFSVSNQPNSLFFQVKSTKFIFPCMTDKIHDILMPDQWNSKFFGAQSVSSWFFHAWLVKFAIFRLWLTKFAIFYYLINKICNPILAMTKFTILSHDKLIKFATSLFYDKLKKLEISLQPMNKIFNFSSDHQWNLWFSMFDNKLFNFSVNTKEIHKCSKLNQQKLGIFLHSVYEICNFFSQ